MYCCNFTVLSSFFDVKKQRPKTNFGKYFQCKVNTEISIDLKVYFSLVTCKINNLIALHSTNQITEISTPWWLTKEFKGKISCFGENTEECITFSARIAKEVRRIDKKRKYITKTISYRLQFTDKSIFVAIPLSNLLIIFLKKIINLNLNTDTMIKNVKLSQLFTNIVSTFSNT